MHRKVNRQDFEVWVELVEGDITREPDYRQSNLRVNGEFESGVKWECNFRALEKVGSEYYFARYDDWDTVRLDNYALANVSLFGKGARARETSRAAVELLRLLVPDLESY